MAKLIKNNEIIEDNWSVLSKEQCEAGIPDAQVLIPVSVYIENQAELDGKENIGVWFEGSDEPEALADALNKFSVIAINFPKFADGRGYSIARVIREHYNYQGELRAIGDVLRDQLFYLKRCGFDAFAIREDRNIEEALESLNDFSEVYQAAADGTTALFNRR